MVNVLMTSISREPDCDVHRRDRRRRQDQRSDRFVKAAEYLGLLWFRPYSGGGPPSLWRPSQ